MSRRRDAPGAPLAVRERPAADEVRLVAFYLPQFHPIPENDAWWGPGFTEWSNVARARPLFEGHHQPRLPADLGYYDLRVPEVREQQAALARSYGIHAFCYYYYWFSGRRLLERPLDAVLASGSPSLPFCICWANENWTRRWDGAEDEVLIGQVHSPESDLRFIHDVIPILRDPRYLHYGGLPVLVVYRADILPDPASTAEIWRETARAEGLPGLHLIAAQTFGLSDPRPLGFDAAVEFPPHGIVGSRRIYDLPGLSPEFRGKIHDYREAVELGLAKERPVYRLHRGVMTAWDNTARRGLHGHVWHHAGPGEYERWLRGVIEESLADPSDREPLVFLNAWNEWAEGAHLEPDERGGHAYLQATRRAWLQAAPQRGEAAVASVPAPRDIEDAAEEAQRLQRRVDALERANRALREELALRDALDQGRIVHLAPAPPTGWPGRPAGRAGPAHLHLLAPVDGEGTLLRSAGLRIRVAGSVTAPDPDPRGKDGGWCLVLSSDTTRYWAPLPAPGPGGSACRFSVRVWLDGIAPGDYEIELGLSEEGRTALAGTGARLRVPDA